MQKKNETRIIYYKDELNDDFANNNIKQISLPDDYKYIHKNVFFKIGQFLVKLIVIPAIFLITKLFCHQKFVNKKVLKISN